MSSEHQPTNLGPFEARLAQLLPRTAEVDRDEVLFEAGRQSARCETRRALRQWQAACGVLLCLAIVPWISLPATSQPGGGLNASTEPNVERNSNSTTEPSAPQASSPILVQSELTPHDPEKSSPTDDDQAEIAAGFSDPSAAWYRIFPQLYTGDPSLALQSRLSIGSSRRGSINMSSVTPFSGGLPSSTEPTLTTLRNDWSPE